MRSNENEDLYTYSYGSTPTLFIYHYAILFFFFIYQSKRLLPTANPKRFSIIVEAKPIGSAENYVYT